jgi:hypothetical protein
MNFHVPHLGEFFGTGSAVHFVFSSASVPTEETAMRKSVAFSIAIVASLLQLAPSRAVEVCAIGVSALPCKMPDRKPEHRTHPRHRAVEKQK